MNEKQCTKEIFSSPEIKNVIKETKMVSNMCNSVCYHCYVQGKTRFSGILMASGADGSLLQTKIY